MSLHRNHALPPPSGAHESLPSLLLDIREFSLFSSLYSTLLARKRVLLTVASRQQIVKKQSTYVLVGEALRRLKTQFPDFVLALKPRLKSFVTSKHSSSCM